MTTLHELKIALDSLRKWSEDNSHPYSGPIIRPAHPIHGWIKALDWFNQADPEAIFSEKTILTGPKPHPDINEPPKNSEMVNVFRSGYISIDPFTDHDALEAEVRSHYLSMVDQYRDHWIVLTDVKIVTISQIEGRPTLYWILLTGEKRYTL